MGGDNAITAFHCFLRQIIAVMSLALRCMSLRQQEEHLYAPGPVVG
jgi:hypothetical protein